MKRIVNLSQQQRKPKITQLIENAQENEKQKRLYLEQCGYSLHLEKSYSMFEEIMLKNNKLPNDIDLLRHFLNKVTYFQQILSTMPVRLVAKLIKALKLVNYAANQIICRVGSRECQDFYVVIKGEILQTMASEQHSYTFTDTFGGQLKPEFSAVAKSEATLLYLSHSAYHEMLVDYHEQQQNHKLEFIHSNSLFSQMSSNRVKQRLHIFKEEHYQRGAIFFKEQDSVEFCWLIITGEVELSELVEVSEMKRRLKVSLGVSTQHVIFGEREYMEQQAQRVHRAEAVTEVSCYRIAIGEFSDLIAKSDIHDVLLQEYKTKATYWKQRVGDIQGNLLKVQSAKNLQKPEVEVLHEKYTSQVSIPRSKTNYISASKLKGRKQTSDLDEELKQAQFDKLREVQELMNYQVKKQFGSNYIMRRLLIGAHRQKVHIEVMDGLNLEKYANPTADRQDRVRKLLNLYQSISGAHSEQIEAINTPQLFENVKLKHSISHQRISSSTQTNIRSLNIHTASIQGSAPVRLLSATSAKTLISPSPESKQRRIQRPQTATTHINQIKFAVTNQEPHEPRPRTSRNMASVHFFRDLFNKK